MLVGLLVLGIRKEENDPKRNLYKGVYVRWDSVIASHPSVAIPPRKVHSHGNARRVSVVVQWWLTKERREGVIVEKLLSSFRRKTKLECRNRKIRKEKKKGGGGACAKSKTSQVRPQPFLP